MTTNSAVLSCFSRVRFFVTLWTTAHQAPLSMRLSRQEYWSGVVPSCRGSSQPLVEPVILKSPAFAGRFFTTGATKTDLLSESSEGQLSKVICRTEFLTEAVGENPFPWLSQLLYAACIPWLTAHITVTSAPGVTFLSLRYSRLPLMQTSVNALGPVDNIPISRFLI